jgi:hypothetical protein
VSNDLLAVHPEMSAKLAGFPGQGKMNLVFRVLNGYLVSSDARPPFGTASINCEPAANHRTE